MQELVSSPNVTPFQTELGKPFWTIEDGETKAEVNEGDQIDEIKKNTDFLAELIQNFSIRFTDSPVCSSQELQLRAPTQIRRCLKLLDS